MTLPLDTARRRAPDERPQQILDAALAVFDEEGLDRARLDDIARRAGIAKGTIYLYFPNKEALFREVLRQTIGSGRLERGIERGEFRRVDTAATARIFAALFVAQALWACKPAIAQSVDAATPEQIFDQLCDFVLHALRPAVGEGVSHI